MTKTSRAVVITRVVLAVVLLSLVFTCVYFFILKAKQDAAHQDNTIFVKYNTFFNSNNVKDINKNLGGLQEGEYYTYAQSQGGMGYEEAYLVYYASLESLSTTNFRLISSYGDASQIDATLNKLEDQAAVLLRSQIVYNTSKNSYGNTPTVSQSQALYKNFEMIVADLALYGQYLYELSSQVFAYTYGTYYADFDAFRSAQYLYGYCLDKQIGLLSAAVMANVDNVDSNLFAETLLMTEQFSLVSQNGFVVQSTDTTTKKVIDYFVDDANNNFESLLNARDKADFVNNITNATQKQKSTDVMIVLGLEGRL